MKLLFTYFFIIVLLIQAFTEATSDEGFSLVQTGEESHGNNVDAAAAGLYKKNKALKPKINCSYACGRRCREASRKNVCHRACKTCCERCSCVPPGTYGNKGACPCYANLRTRGHKPKCP